MHPPKPEPQPFQLWTDVYPPRGDKAPATLDGRTTAIQLFSDYFSNLKFYAQANNGNFTEFCVPAANIQIDYPDYEENYKLPGAAILAGKGTFNPNGFGPIPIEASKDVFKEGYILHVHDEYEETFILELSAAKREQIRALAGAVSTMFQPSMEITGLRFFMKGYYDTTVIFTLISSQIIEEPDASLDRRRCNIEINMRFNVVSLDPYKNMVPMVEVETLPG